MKEKELDKEIFELKDKSKEIEEKIKLMQGEKLLLGKTIEKLEQKKKAQLYEDQQRSVDTYIKLMEEFKKSPSKEKAEIIISTLKDLKFKELPYRPLQLLILPYHDEFCLWLYETQDVLLFEKYLLAKMGYDKKDLPEIDKRVESYLMHLEKDGYTDTEEGSQHTLSARTGLYQEDLMYFLTLLAIDDFQSKPVDFKEEVYLSRRSKQMILRAVVDSYGYIYSYIQYDGEYGHCDFEKKRYEEVFKSAYLYEQEKVSELTSE